MTTFTSARGVTTVPTAGTGWSHEMLPIYGFIAVAANPVAADVYNMVWTPQNFLLMEGQFAADDMDTNGTPTLDLNVGWVANGGASETYKASDGTVYTNAAGSTNSSGLLNNATLSGSAVTGYIAGGSLRPFVLGAPLFFSRPTLITITAETTAATFAAGNMSVLLKGRII